MKKLLLFVVVLVSANAIAQNAITLQKGQAIKITNTSHMTAELGMGMQMTNDVTAIANAVVKDENDVNYVISSKVTKLVVKSEMMGNNTNYDSDKKEDQETEVGKSLASFVNTESTTQLNKATGKVDSMKVADVDGETQQKLGPLSETMQNISGDVMIAGIYQGIPAGAKPGVTWSDTTNKDGLNAISHYTLKSVDNGISTIDMKGTMTGAKQIEAQGGMQIDMTIDAKNSGTILVAANGLVKKRTLKVEMTNEMNVAGQAMTMTATTDSESTVE